MVAESQQFIQGSTTYGRKYNDRVCEAGDDFRSVDRLVYLTFRNSKIASGIFGEEDFSTRIRRRTLSLRAVFPVFDGVGLAFNGSGKGLRSERSLHGMRRDGRVGSSGQVRESLGPPLVCGGLSCGEGGG